MSDLVQNFEAILKNHSSKPTLGIYKNIKIPRNIPQKPSDVIKSVASQLKAIQVSENTRFPKALNKDLKESELLKKSEFLCVNNLPIYVEATTHHTNQFDTQFVSDTQLINVVEDVEMIDKNLGMTEEFETSFRHKNTDMYTNDEDINENDDRAPNVDNVNVNITDDDENINADKQNNVADRNKLENDKENVSLYNKTVKDIDTNQTLNRSKDIDDANTESDKVKERTPSPVLNIKKLPQKSQTPPPLVYNLDVFEKFESLALSIIENCDIDRVRHVINSQILGKELCVKMDNDIELNEGASTLPRENARNSVKLKNKSVFDADCVKTFKYTDNNKSEHVPFEKGVGSTSEVKNYLESDRNFLEDEILFSSDEEDDYVNKAYENIPFTIALESSGNEQSDVLDKTVYVGFQTASDRSIQVSTESLIKAQSILSNVATENLSLTDMVKLCDGNNKIASIDAKTETIMDVNGNSSTEYNEPVTKNTILEQNVKFNSKTCTEANETTGKDDKIKRATKEMKSNISLDSVKGIGWEESTQTNINEELLIQELENIEMSLDEDKKIKQISNMLGYKTVSNLGLESEVVDEKLQIKGQLSQLIMTPLILDGNLTGFKTASNKQISISEAALRTSNKIFQDIDSKSIDDLKSLNNHQKLPSNSTIIPYRNNNLSITNDPPSWNNGEFVGFKTGSNREIHISNASLAKTKSIFKDIDSPDFKIPRKSVSDCGTKDLNKLKSIDSNPPEIKMNNSKMVTKSKYTIDNQNKEDRVIMCEPVFQGFKTASNKRVDISKEALAKTKCIFDGIDVFECDIKNGNKATQSVSKSLLENTEKEKMSIRFHNIIDDKSEDLKELVINRKLVDTINIKSAKATHNTATPFVGFQMASNKSVAVSEEALAKSRKLFQDINSAVLEEQDEYLSCKETIKLNEDFTNRTTSMRNIVRLPFSGFHTASKKKISISEDALVQSRKIFQDIDSDSTKEHHNTKYSIGPSISDQEFKGFQTASNKKVCVSEEALVKSKNLFRDIDKVIVEKHITTELNTKLCEDLGETETLVKNSFKKPYRGFHTASKKKISVSEEALIKSRKIFDRVDAGNTHVVDRNNTKDLNEPNGSAFSGFQTANNKKVRISEEALAKTKSIFNDIDLLNSIENNAGKAKNDTKLSGVFIKKAINDNVIPSNALGKINRISDIDLVPGDTENELKNVSKPRNFNEQEIDTQLLNNFEESLHTNDFKITPVKSKRSGSPILSCPRAKKRKKFETPYSQTMPKIEIPIIATKVKNKFSFDDNYKKNKLYTLRDLEKFCSETDTIDVHNLSIDKLLDFKFHGKRNDLSNATVSIDELSTIFKDSVNEKLIPDGWLENHLKLILWKLLSYEVKFSKMGNMCTVMNVLNQLKYRYDRELYNAERPALRKIFERDDVSTKTMVLCVVDIYVDGVKVNSVTDPTINIEILLTDGWYCIMATIDRMLSKLVYDGKIVVGTKIATSGAELVNCENGVPPWENTSEVRLKLSGNSTRCARWDARLGYHGNAAILSRLSHVKMDGGKICKLRVFITRVYPALYVEKFEDGSTVTRSERLEHLHQMKYETERQVLMEKLYEEVEREFHDQDSQDSDGYSDSGGKRACWDSGTQIAKLMKKSNDPCEFQAQLTNSQTKLLEEHAVQRREKLLQKIQNKLRDKIEKNGLTTARNVVPVLKIRVAGFEEKNQKIEVIKGMMSIWKPNDAILEIIKEGTWIDVMNVVPTGMRYSEIQISAGRQSIFSHAKSKEPDKFRSYTELLKRQCFTIKDLAQSPVMATDYNEIDTVGLIFLIDPVVEHFDPTKQLFQNVYLADADKNMVCVNFWGGLKKFGFENVLDTGQVVSCVNLQKRAGNTRKNIPQYRVTEFSSFTKTPKNDKARNTVDELNKIFQSLDRRKFCDDCTVLKNNFSAFKYQCVNNISPYRANVSEYNLSRNKVFIDSPLAMHNKFEDFNLTGLDFESTFKQDTQDLSEEMLLRKKRVNDKINKLKRYGEPPPLSPLHIINKSKKTLSHFKSPVISKENDTNLANAGVLKNQFQSKPDCLNNAANLNNTPQKMGVSKASDNQPSPVLLNRTYVKSVKPVKLNFNVEETSTSDVIDHFAEEFDGSPPLSLD